MLIKCVFSITVEVRFLRAISKTTTILPLHIFRMTNIHNFYGDAFTILKRDALVDSKCQSYADV